MEQLTLEGTWEEILRHAPELVGQRVKLTVLSAEEPQPPAPVTLAEALKGRVGQVQFLPSDLSTRSKSAFTDILSDKHTQL